MGDLSITALYTSAVWAWGGVACAELFESVEAKRVFGVTNAALAIQRGTPLRYALLHRHAMIDRLARPARRVLEIAAGLSPRGAAFTREPGVHYVEVDLPPVIAHKGRLLERTPAGREVLARTTFELVAGDVETLELAPLVRGLGPTTVVAEGLVIYLDGPARRRLFARLAALPDIELVFDLVPSSEEPPAGLAGRALEAAMKRFTGGRTFERDARTRADVLAELRAAGFAHATAIAARDVARAWELPHAERPTNTVVFTARGARSTPS